MMVRAFRNADCPGRVRFPGRTEWIGIQCCVHHPLDQEDDGKLSAGGSEEVEALSFLGKYSEETWKFEKGKEAHMVERGANKHFSAHFRSYSVNGGDALFSSSYMSLRR